MFYDLVTAAVLHIHNEEIWEEAPLDMVDDSSLVRPFMENHASQLCPDFDSRRGTRHPVSCPLPPGLMRKKLYGGHIGGKIRNEIYV